MFEILKPCRCHGLSFELYTFIYHARRLIRHKQLFVLSHELTKSKINFSRMYIKKCYYSVPLFCFLTYLMLQLKTQNSFKNLIYALKLMAYLLIIFQLIIAHDWFTYQNPPLQRVRYLLKVHQLILLVLHFISNSFHRIYDRHY